MFHSDIDWRSLFVCMKSKERHDHIYVNKRQSSITTRIETTDFNLSLLHSAQEVACDFFCPCLSLTEKEEIEAALSAMI